MSPAGIHAPAAQAVIADGAAIAARLRARGASAAATLSTTATAEAARIQAEHQQAVAALRAGLQGRRANLVQQAAGQRGAVQAAAQGAHAEIDAAAGAQRGQLGAAVQRQQAAAVATTDAEAQTTSATSAQEAQRFASASQTRGRQVAAGGPTSSDEAVASSQRDAYVRAEAQAADNFAQDDATVASATQHAANDFADGLHAKLAEFTGQLATAASDVRNALEHHAAAAVASATATGDQGAAALVDHAHGVGDALGAGGDAAEQHLDEAAQQAIGDLTVQAERYGAAVIAQLEAAARAAEQAAAEAAVAVGDDATAAAEARGQLAAAGAQADQEAAAADAKASIALRHGAAAAQTAQRTAGASIAAQLGEVATAASARLTEAGGQVVAGVRTGGATAASQLAEVGRDAVAAIADQGGQFAAGARQAGGAARSEIAQRVAGASAEQATNAATIERRAGAAGADMASRHAELTAEGDRRAAAGAEHEGQAFLEWLLPQSWSDGIRSWFRTHLGDVLGGIVYGLINAVVGLVIAGVIIWATGGIGLIVLLLVGLVAGIWGRFQMFQEYNGRGPGWLEGTGLVVLGILDLTGLPQIIEGAVGQRAFSNGNTLDSFERAELITSGLIQLVAIFFLVRGLKGAGRAGPRPVDPVRVGPVDPIDPVDPVDPTRPPVLVRPAPTTVELTNVGGASSAAELARMQPGSGFSVAYNPATGEFLALPGDTNALFLDGTRPTNGVGRYGGHAITGEALAGRTGAAVADLRGGSLILEADGAISAGFNSGTLGGIPVAVQQAFMDAVARATGRTVRPR